MEESSQKVASIQFDSFDAGNLDSVFKHEESDSIQMMRQKVGSVLVGSQNSGKLANGIKQAESDSMEESRQKAGGTLLKIFHAGKLDFVIKQAMSDTKEELRQKASGTLLKALHSGKIDNAIQKAKFGAVKDLQKKAFSNVSGDTGFNNHHTPIERVELRDKALSTLLGGLESGKLSSSLHQVKSGSVEESRGKAMSTLVGALNTGRFHFAVEQVKPDCIERTQGKAISTLLGGIKSGKLDSATGKAKLNFAHEPQVKAVNQKALNTLGSINSGKVESVVQQIKSGILIRKAKPDQMEAELRVRKTDQRSTALPKEDQELREQWRDALSAYRTELMVHCEGAESLYDPAVDRPLAAYFKKFGHDAILRRIVWENSCCSTQPPASVVKGSVDSDDASDKDTWSNGSTVAQGSDTGEKTVNSQGEKSAARCGPRLAEMMCPDVQWDMLAKESSARCLKLDVVTNADGDGLAMLDSSDAVTKIQQAWRCHWDRVETELWVQSRQEATARAQKAPPSPQAIELLRAILPRTQASSPPASCVSDEHQPSWAQALSLPLNATDLTLERSASGPLERSPNQHRQHPARMYRADAAPQALAELAFKEAATVVQKAFRSHCARRNMGAAVGRLEAPVMLASALESTMLLPAERPLAQSSPVPPVDTPDPRKFSRARRLSGTQTAAVLTSSQLPSALLGNGKLSRPILAGDRGRLELTPRSPPPNPPPGPKVWTSVAGHARRLRPVVAPSTASFRLHADDVVPPGVSEYELEREFKALGTTEMYSLDKPQGCQRRMNKLPQSTWMEIDHWLFPQPQFRPFPAAVSISGASCSAAPTLFPTTPGSSCGVGRLPELPLGGGQKQTAKMMEILSTPRAGRRIRS